MERGQRLLRAPERGGDLDEAAGIRARVDLCSGREHPLRLPLSERATPPTSQEYLPAMNRPSPASASPTATSARSSSGKKPRRPGRNVLAARVRSAARSGPIPGGANAAVPSSTADESAGTRPRPMSKRSHFARS